MGTGRLYTLLQKKCTLISPSSRCDHGSLTLTQGMSSLSNGLGSNMQKTFTLKCMKETSNLVKHHKNAFTNVCYGPHKIRVVFMCASLGEESKSSQFFFSASSKHRPGFSSASSTRTDLYVLKYRCRNPAQISSGVNNKTHKLANMKGEKNFFPAIQDVIFER